MANENNLASQIKNAFPPVSEKPAASSGANDRVASFARDMAPIAERVSAETGVDPAVLIGQWGLETGWGKSVIPGTNNFGNIKDFRGSGVTARDNMNGSVDKYRAYESPEDFAGHFAQLLKTGRYKGALGALDAQSYFSALKAGGYAEDPNYVRSGVKAADMVKRVMGEGRPAASIYPERGEYIGQTEKVQERTRRQEAADESPLSTSLGRGFEGLKHNVKQFASNLAGDSDAVAERIRAKREWDEANPAPSSSEKFTRQWQSLAEDDYSGMLGAALSNPGGMLNQMVEQTPNSLPGLALQIPTAIASGALLATGWGAPIAIGLQGLAAFAGNVMPEGGAIIEERLAKSGVNPNDTAAVAKWIADNRNANIEGGVKKAGVISLVDGATGYLGAKMIAGPAVRYAKAEQAALANAGINLSDKAAVAAARATPAYKQAMAVPAKELLDATTRAQKTVRELGGVGLETVGEGVGEYAGSYAVNGEASVKDAVLESLMGAGNSAAMTGANMATAAMRKPEIDRAALGALAATPVQPVIKQNSPLSNMASVGQAAQANAEQASAQVAPEQAGAAVPGVNTPAQDPTADRLAAMQSFVEDKAFIQALRGTEGYGPESVTELLSAYAKARNPNIDPRLRERALSDLEKFVETFNNRPNFVFGKNTQEPTPQPGQSVAPYQQQGGAVGPTIRRPDGRTLDGEIITRPEGMAGANPNQLKAPPVLGLPTEEALQAKRQADADYEQAYQDLVKAEQLGANEAEIADYQRALLEAERLRDELAAQLADSDARVADSQQREAEARRRDILGSVIEQGISGVNPVADVAGRFSAELMRQGYRDTAPTDAETQSILRAVDVANAREDGPLPSLPNEGDFYAPPKAQRTAPPKAEPKPKQQPNRRLTPKEIREYVAAGAILNGDTLTLPDGTVLKLKGPQIAAAREAMRKVAPAQVESAPDQANETEVSPQDSAPQQVESPAAVSENPAETPDVSTRTDDQLRYLANNGKPGWKEAAQAEMARREGAKPAEFEHRGVRIYPANVSIAGERKQMWGVESSANKAKREAGERHGFGDSLHETREQAIDAADRQIREDRERAEYDRRMEEIAAKKRADDAARKADTINGFLEGKAPNTQELIRKALDKQYRFDGTVMTVRERIESLRESDELVTDSFEEPKIKPMSRVQFNRASQREQDAHEKKMREAGTKTVYTVSGSELGKYAYDYAQHLLTRGTTGEVKAEIRSDLDAAAHEAATSPLNDTPQPTEAQKEAGNYKVGRVKYRGMDISIENPKGSVRSGTDQDGNRWESTMASHYGYFTGTKAADGDHLDVFLTDGAEDAPWVWVIDQKNQDGSFDEHKVVLGPRTEYEARLEYLANYEPGWNGLGAISSMPPDVFKAWAFDGKKKRKPLVYVEPEVTAAEASDTATAQPDPREAYADQKAEAYIAQRGGNAPPKAVEAVRIGARKEFDKGQDKQSKWISLDEYVKSHPNVRETRARSAWASDISDAITEGKEVPPTIVDELLEKMPGFAPDAIASRDVLMDRYKQAIDTDIERAIERLREEHANLAKKLDHKRVKTSHEKYVEVRDQLISLNDRIHALEQERRDRARGDFTTETAAEDYLVRRLVQLSGVSEEGAKTRIVRAMVSAQPTHQDPGQPAEAVTPTVVAKSIQKSARNTEFNPAEAKKWLLGEIDKAVANVPAENAELAAELARYKSAAYEKETTRQFGVKEFKARRNSNIDRLSKQIGFVTFDVPGDGKFKVMNTVDGLNAFRSKVEKSPGFKNPAIKPPTMRSETNTGSYGPRDAILEGDYLNAYELAKLQDKPLVFSVGTNNQKPTAYTDTSTADGIIDGIAFVVGREATKDGKWFVIEPATGILLNKNGLPSKVAALTASKAITKGKEDGLRRVIADPSKAVPQSTLEAEWLAWAEKEEGVTREAPAEDAPPKDPTPEEPVEQEESVSSGPSTPIAESVADDAPDLDPLETAIPGVSEILRLSKSVSNDGARYASQFSRMMEDEGNDGARPPKLTDDDAKKRLKEMLAANPRAAQYVRALAFEDASNYMKAAAGTKAKNMLLAGESAEKAKAALDDWTGEKAKLEESKSNDARLREIMTRENGWDVVESMPEFFSPEWRGLQGQGYKMYMLGRDGNPIENTLNGSVMAKPLPADSENTDARKDAQSSIKQPTDLTNIFAGLSSRGLAKTRAQKAAQAHPRAEQIAYVQDNFLDILTELEDSGIVKINCD